MDQSLAAREPSWFLGHLSSLSVYSMHRAAFGLGWPQVLYKNITSKNVAILVSYHYYDQSCCLRLASCVCE